MSGKKHIKSLNQEELLLFCKQNGEYAFREKQLSTWLFSKCITDFDQMTNLPSKFRNILKNNFICNGLLKQEEICSKDGTRKYAFTTTDKLTFESVLIPSGKRLTACISTQIGCPLNCRFCATGNMGFFRNLTHYEIHDQIALLMQYAHTSFQTKITNIVVMGMGEPLLNYDNLIMALNRISSKDALNFSSSRITLSTVGITEGIIRLADENSAYHLAISLHSAIEEKRKKLIPAAKKYTLSELRAALKYYVQKTGKRITIEYLLLNEINDDKEDAKALAEFCRHFPVKINLISYNDIGSLFKKSTLEKQEAFKLFLQQKNLVVNLRISKGADISAACGQLVKQIKNKNYE